MTSLEYVYKLFEVSADQLGVDYVKTTPTKLQSWATKRNPPFIALLGFGESIETNDLNNNIISYECSFVVCGSSPKDPTNEEKLKLEIETDKILKRFLWFIKKNEDTVVTDITAEEIFRGSTFNGVGRGLGFTISIADKIDYCIDWCNDSTKRIDCDD